MNEFFNSLRRVPSTKGFRFFFFFFLFSFVHCFCSPPPFSDRNPVFSSSMTHPHFYYVLPFPYSPLLLLKMPGKQIGVLSATSYTRLALRYFSLCDRNLQLCLLIWFLFFKMAVAVVTHLFNFPAHSPRISGARRFNTSWRAKWMRRSQCWLGNAIIKVAVTRERHMMRSLSFSFKSAFGLAFGARGWRIVFFFSTKGEKERYRAKWWWMQIASHWIEVFCIFRLWNSGFDPIEVSINDRQSSCLFTSAPRPEPYT